MNSRLAIKRLEESLLNIRSITRVFEHTAAKKMDVNRREIAKLAGYIREARESYTFAKVAANMGHKDGQARLGLAYREPTKRKVLIMVSSESKYFGNLINSLVKLFMSEFRQGAADGIVIGEVGKKLLEREGFRAANITYFDFNDDKPDWTVVSRVSEQLGSYREIVIFYGQYRSILTQELRREDIAKSVVIENLPQIKKYEFEPKADGTLAMLERQIISSNFLQKLYETGLTKNAVAVKILEIGAIADRINTAMTQLSKFKLRLTKDNNNRKQTQLFASKGVWEQGGIFTMGGDG